MGTLSITLAVAAALMALAAWRLLNRARAAEARAAQAELGLGTATRSLGLLARELEVPGLSLLGLGARLPPEAASAVEAEGRRLLSLSEEVSDHLATPFTPRRITENRIPLGPLLREAVAEIALPLGHGARHW